MGLHPTKPRTLPVSLCLLNVVTAAELGWILETLVSSRSDDQTSSGSDRQVAHTRPELAIWIIVVALLIIVSLFFAGLVLRRSSTNEVLIATSNAILFFAVGVNIFVATVMHNTSVLGSSLATIPAIVGCILSSMQRAALRQKGPLQERLSGPSLTVQAEVPWAVPVRSS